MPDEKVFSVSEITREIKRVLKENFGTIWIEGEISGYKRHPSGHHYFTLKDASAQIPCALWKTNASRVNFSPGDGMKVQAWGNLEVYEPAGRYQFIVAMMRPAGVGDLQRAFEALVEKLKAEGLFALERKRSLPRYPERIGLVTSSSGAVLQDMRTVAARRWPMAELILAPVKVQGVGAAEEIADAIAVLNRRDDVDVIVVGRGGGSLEDLWAFNEEMVARAIFASRIPVVSAVGHEVDFTVADFVADLRAPTPSAAMEIILPDRQEVLAQLSGLERKLALRRQEIIRHYRNRLDRLAQHWAFRQPENMVQMALQRIDDLRARLETGFRYGIAEDRRHLDRTRELLTLFHPRAILRRGFAIVQNGQGTILRNSASLHEGEALTVSFAQGGVLTRVEHIQDQGILDEPA